MNPVKILAASAVAVLLSTGAVFARPVVSLVTHGYVVSGTGESQKLLEFSSDVSPHAGDLIEWKVVARNDSSEAARKFVTKLPIPPSTTYVAGSATGPSGATVAFSIDGGRSFSSRPMRPFHTPHGDVMKAADVSSYTTVEWTSGSDLSPHATASFSYEAKVK